MKKKSSFLLPIFPASERLLRARGGGNVLSPPGLRGGTQAAAGSGCAQCSVGVGREVAPHPAGKLKKSYFVLGWIQEALKSWERSAGQANPSLLSPRISKPQRWDASKERASAPLRGRGAHTTLLGLGHGLPSGARLGEPGQSDGRGSLRGRSMLGTAEQ